MASLQTLAPLLQVKDVRKSAIFYCSTLGFSLNFAVSEARETLKTLEEQEGVTLVYAQLAQNGVEIMLQAVEYPDADDAFLQGAHVGDSAVSFYCLVENADTLSEELRGKAEIVSGPRTSWYGMREVFIRDPDGYILGFAHSAAGEAA